MKKNIFIALFFTAFMFPFFGSISNADALGNYGCGNPDKKTHVNCLRGLLSSTPHGVAVQQSSPSNDGLGNYGCGNRNKRTHVNCLRGLLDQHGAHLQVGNHGGGASGTHPPVDISHCATLPPDTRPQCEAAAHGGPPPGGQHNGPPPGGPVDHPDCPAGTTCGGPNDHHGDQQDCPAGTTCGGQHNGPPPGGPVDHPDCPAGTTCGGPNDHHGDQQDCPAGTTCGGQHNGPPPGGHEGGDPSAACAAIPHPDGSAHVDPPEAIINDVEEEYKANCQAGACSLSEATYLSLESLGHSRGEIDCFLAAGERQHNEEHGGNHPPAGNP